MFSTLVYLNVLRIKLMYKSYINIDVNFVIGLVIDRWSVCECVCVYLCSECFVVGDCRYISWIRHLFVCFFACLFACMTALVIWNCNQIMMNALICECWGKMSNVSTYSIRLLISIPTHVPTHLWSVQCNPTTNLLLIDLQHSYCT